ncbi:Polygalacturonase [Sesamum angolense]|uniref:Polygalacturonase n=1 Tax=Sesamum angolense TaxID=2727404 RepID=A0AAE1T9J0_9LAMI|nr:Polygalacturonase [Sesamum angolense]
MAINFITILFFLPLLAINVNAQGPVTYDITKYGAKPGGDISQALTDAWNEASNSTTPSIIVIPRGTWSLSQVKLTGNKAPLELQVQGTVQANPNPSQLPNKEGEWITINYVNYFTLSGGGVFDGQGQEAWKQNDCHKNRNCAKLPMNLSFNFINNSIIRDVTTKDSKNFHVNCISSHNVTFLRFTISAPGDSPNTDGIHLGRDTMIHITDSVIKTGDDCVSIGDETKEVHIHNVTCGPGHGISVGSLGGYASEKDVQGIYVTNCTFIGTQNGVSPVIIDQEYCPHNLAKKIIKNVRGTTNSAEAVTLICSGLKPCENVEVGDIDLTYNGNQGPITTRCSNVKPKFVGKQNPPVCATTAKSA